MDELINSQEANKATQGKPRSAVAHSMVLALVGLLAVACLVLLVVLIYSLFSSSADIGSQLPLFN